jgi:hypothetical protein
MQVQHVDQILDAILGGDGAADGQNGQTDQEMALSRAAHGAAEAHRTAGGTARSDMASPFAPVSS